MIEASQTCLPIIRTSNKEQPVSPSTKSTLVTVLDDPLRSAVQAAKQTVSLASPFITFEICHWMSARVRRGRADWRVLTELDAGPVAHGSLNLNGLRLLMAAGVQLRHVDGLHAKLFLTETVG